MPDKALNVLLFSTLFPHKGEPSLGIFVENRLRNLLAHKPNIQATVIAPVPWFPFKHKIFGAYAKAAKADYVEHKDGLTIYHPRYLVIPKIGMMLTPKFLFWSAWRCYKRLVKAGERFGIIDAHYLYPDAVAARALADKAQLPYVVTARGSDVTQIGLMPKPRNKIVSAITGAAHAITVSENLRQDLIAMGVPEGHVTTLRNGVDLVRFKEIGRKAGRMKFPDRPILLFAGWLIPRKRIDLVLRVTQLLPDITTVIVGSGPLQDKSTAMAEELGISDRVVFAGQKTPEEMPGYYSLADVLLLPSDREGWANVLLESMACGTPVVSRAIGGAPDLIRSDVAGQVVDSEEPELLAAAVQKILDNPPSREAVREYSSDYDWSAISEAQNQIFQRSVADSVE